MRSEFKDSLGAGSDPAPPASMVPKPSVGNWAPVTLNFGAARPAAVADKEKTASTPSTTTSASSVPKAFSNKPFSLSSTIGKPPVPATAEGETKTENGASAATGSASTASGSASTASDSATAASSTTGGSSNPLIKQGFKFNVSTTWSHDSKPSGLFGKSSAATTPSSAGGDAKVAPATTMKWNFLGTKTAASPGAPGSSTATGSSSPAAGSSSTASGAGSADFKPAPLSTHFGASKTSSFTGLKTNFQFGKNVPPAKPSEPSKEVLSSLADASSAHVDSAKTLADTAPVETKTGEEDEEVLFKADAKLNEFDLTTKTWVERGVGTFRINQLKDESKSHKINKFRLLMHVKTTLKLILNSFIFVGMSASIIDDKPTCIKFSATPMPVAPKSKEDEAGNTDASAAAPAAAPAAPAASAAAAPQSAISIFIVRFRDTETAALCLKHINDSIAAKTASSSSTTTTTTTTTESTTTSESKPVETAAEKKDSSSDVPAPTVAAAEGEAKAE